MIQTTGLFLSFALYGMTITRHILLLACRTPTGFDRILDLIELSVRELTLLQALHIGILKFSWTFGTDIADKAASFTEDGRLFRVMACFCL